MSTTLAANFIAQAPGYVGLQREVHDALRAQHPEWILPNGESPTCDSYESRLVKLLGVSLVSEHARDPGSSSMSANYAEANSVIFPEMASMSKDSYEHY